LREAYRQQQHLLTAGGLHIAFLWADSQHLPTAEIFARMKRILQQMEHLPMMQVQKLLTQKILHQALLQEIAQILQRQKHLLLMQLQLQMQLQKELPQSLYMNTHQKLHMTLCLRMEHGILLQISHWR
jgi:hypothetical protein